MLWARKRLGFMLDVTQRWLAEFAIATPIVKQCFDDRGGGKAPCCWHLQGKTMHPQWNPILM